MKKIAIIAPFPIEGSGGVARIYNFASALSQAKFECHLFAFDAGLNDSNTLKINAERWYRATGFFCHTSLEGLSGQFDLAIATRWDTVPMVQRLDSTIRAYLVQDYEAYFNSVGDASILAENSYLQGFVPLTYGRWLDYKLAADFANTPYHFEFSSDTNFFQCKTPMIHRLDTTPKIAFIYQDNKPRRCPRLGIEALGIINFVRPDVEFLFIGSNTPPSLWYNFRNLGNVSLTELSAIYNQCHVGLSLSSSNPSCNSFDMMACGLPSVDLFRENNLFDVPAGGVLLAHQTQESIAEALLHLLNNPAELVRRSEFGIDFMHTRSQDKEVETFLQAIDEMLENNYNSAFRRCSQTAMYDAAPVVAPVNRNSFTAAFLRNQLPSSDLNKPSHSETPDCYYATNELTLEVISTGKSSSLSHFELKQNARAKKFAIYERFVRKIVKKHCLDQRLGAELFDASFYLETNPDVAESGIDPLLHFAKHGIEEGRAPSPYFDTVWYSNTYKGTIGNEVSAILHYLRKGSSLNQSPNLFFDSIWYLKRYTDVEQSKIHPLLHYIKYGEKEDRDPSERFSTQWYRRNNPDVSIAGSPLLCHYLLHGREEGRAPTPTSTLYRPRKTEVSFENTIFEAVLDRKQLEPQFIRDQIEIVDFTVSDTQFSFDVWNTIIHRRCHPDEIKLRSARFLLLEGGEEIIPALRNPVLLMNARMRAENLSAPNQDYEYCFNDAVHLWLDAVLYASCSSERRVQIARLILEHELASEKESIELDSNAYRAIKKLQKSPIFVSDFYMSPPFIEQLLDSVGIAEHFLRGYVSCKGFENKRSGALFSRVLQEMGLEPGELTHVGDNLLSDVERPKSLGICTVPYISHADEMRTAWYADAFRDLCAGDPEKHHKRILALVANHIDACSSNESEEYDALYRAGCHVGVLAIGFCLNVMQDAITRKSREVVFFAREGILFKSIYDALAIHNPFQSSAPPSKLIYVSRRATFAASLNSIDTKDLMRIWTMYWRQSPAAFTLSLNLDQTLAQEACQRVGLPFNEVVDAPWQNRLFKEFLEDQDFRMHVDRSLEMQRQLLISYLQQELDLSTSEVLIADIGWRGTIQDNIARTLNRPIRGHYLGLFKYLNAQEDGSSKVGWLSDENNGDEGHLSHNVAPLEMLFNGLGGSTIGYSVTQGGCVQPRREIFPGEESVVSSLQPLRSGMLDIIPLLSKYVQLHGLLATDLLELNRKIARDIISAPPSAIADVYSRLEHNETFGSGTLDTMQDRSFETISKTVSGPDLHENLTSWVGSRWTEGLSRQSDITSWWNSTSVKTRSSAPLSVSKVHAPSILKTTGSRLAVYIPTVEPASGGQRTIFNMIKGLVQIGLNAEVYFEDGASSGEVIEEYLGDTPAEIFSGWSSHRASTIAFATIARSAIYVKTHVSAQFPSYLVQDAEAVFHPMSDEYIRAENTYALGLHHFTVGNWLTHLINNRYGVAAFPAGIGADTAFYHFLDDVRKERAVCMLYDPGKSRRGSDLGLEAISIFQKRNPDVEIYLYGSDELPAVEFKFQHLGIIRDRKALNALYNKCSVGLCISLSNPSRIPFEMASAGCRSVDVYRYNNLMDRNRLMGDLAFQSASSIARALEHSLLSVESSKDLGLELSNSFKNRSLSWEIDAMVANVLAVVEGRECSNWGLERLYRDDPIYSTEDATPASRKFCNYQSKLADGRSMS